MWCMREGFDSCKSAPGSTVRSPRVLWRQGEAKLAREGADTVTPLVPGALMKDAQTCTHALIERDAGFAWHWQRAGNDGEKDARFKPWGVLQGEEVSERRSEVDKTTRVLQSSRDIVKSEERPERRLAARSMTAGQCSAVQMKHVSRTLAHRPHR